MARGEQLGRQWIIVQTLISSQQGKTAADIADAVGCSRRTVYRDLNALQAAGFPIYDNPENGKTRYCMLGADKQNIPIPLQLSELMTLYFCRDMLKSFKNTVFYDSLDSLFGKVRATLPEPFLEPLQQFENVLHVGNRPHPPYEKFKEILNSVNEALVNKRYIEMMYYTMSRRKSSRRTIAPYHLWFFNGTFYLIGHCLMRREVRIFALDRIKMLSQTDECFEIPAEFNVDDYMRNCFGVFQGEPVKVKIHFAPEVAGYIQEKVWHESQEIHPQRDGGIVFEVEVAGIDEIKYWVMSWGSKALVLEPQSLIEAIRKEAESMTENYDRRMGGEKSISA